MRILLKVAYDGTAYSGWQVQPNADTVQERLENAIKDLTGETVRVTGSGRTDAGVHAKGQIAHFETNSTVPAHKFKKALNVRLPDDIRVLESKEIFGDFHAVKSAKKKTYVYTISLIENPLETRYSFFFDRPLDMKLVKKSAKLFVGTHNFKGFSASGCGAKTFDRTIYALAVKKTDEKITFTITGNGFLYKMVRMLVGAMVSVGLNQISLADIKNSLEFGAQPKNTTTLPAKGLTLLSVEYPKFRDK